MKNILIISLVIFIAAAGVAINENHHEFVGTKRCKMCHKGEKNGMVYEKWAEGPHAKAYTVLGEEKARETYTALGKEGNPQEDPECLKCHVTGYGMDSTLTAKLIIEDGVTCETCHGAGGDYWKKNVMESRELSIENGMIAEPKTLCINCHNEESPTYKEFKLEEHWAKISHSIPAEDE